MSAANGQSSSTTPESSKSDSALVSDTDQAAGLLEGAVTLPVANADSDSAPPKRKPLLSRTGKIVAGVVSAISFVTGVIGVWPILFSDSSNFSSLTIAAEPYATGASEYLLPSGTDLSTYPLGDTACTADQLAWLTERAAPLDRRWLLDLRNVASEGAMLALTDFEAVSTPAAGDVGVRVVCDASGTADRIQAARLTVDEPGATALFEAGAFGVSNEAIPDVPVAWNLAPGESGAIVLDLSAFAPASGSVQVTVHSGTEQQLVVIDGLEFTVPGMVEAGRRYLVAAPAGLECHVAGSEELCDAASLLAG